MKTYNGLLKKNNYKYQFYCNCKRIFVLGKNNLERAELSLVKRIALT